MFESNGMHYYVVTTIKYIAWSFVESPFSNCESVIVSSTELPTAPVLAEINPNFTHDRAISLTWSQVHNAAGYRLYQSKEPINSSSVGNASCIATEFSSQTTYTTLESVNGTYFFAVESFNGMGASEPSNCQSVRVVLLAPRAPVLYPISPNPNTRGNVTISWSAVSGADYYSIYTSSRPIPYEGNDSFPVNLFLWPAYTTETSYTSFCTNGVMYFAIIAINSSGSSGYSNCQSVLVNATALASAPVLSILSPNPCNISRISLSWSAVSDAVGYCVYESSTPINDSSMFNANCIANIIEPRTTCIDHRYNNGTCYYAVVAYNAGGVSPMSKCQQIDVILNPIPLNSYVGVAPGDAYLFKVTYRGATGFARFTSNGTYDLVLVVDNVVDNGRSACIEYHEVYSNATDCLLQTNYRTTTIGAEDIAAGDFWLTGWFISKNIANKTISHINTPPSRPPWPGIFLIFFGPSYNATWDNSGVLENATESWNGDPATSSSCVRVGSVTPPFAPRDIQASAGSRKVMLSWQMPEHDGGLPILGYKIFRGTSPRNETLLTTLGNVTEFTDTNVTNGKTYYYTISAFNNAGDRVQSIEVKVTPFTNPPAPQKNPATSETTLLITLCVVAGIIGVVTVTVIRLMYAGMKNVPISPAMACMYGALNRKRALLLRTNILEGEKSPSPPSISPAINLEISHQRCIVHKGTIPVGNNETCRQCGAIYCKNCFKELISCDEKCWNCGALLE